ncbi:MAG: hypothetical protein IJY97_04235 [Clostridia bacterium]|nr:hypothetical protein [Clostridia bacterium]
MKKTLSIIMALSMVLSVCFFSVSAAEAKVGSVAADYKPEGTAITDAAGFAAMAADGIYYLANDITIDASWNAGAAAAATPQDFTAFEGTLDGNGKTITTSVPLFGKLHGTVKNLTVAGSINGNGNYVGAVSCYAKGTLTVENVSNKAAITGGTSTGGILGYGATGTVATFINCSNDVDLIATSQIGGIAGYIQDDVVVIENCVNNGNLRTDNYGAGIIGRFGRDKGALPDSVATITGCVNNGTVSGAKGQSAGILAYLVGGAQIIDCVNNGTIVNDTATSAGILGSTRDPDKKKISGVLIKDCFNYAPVNGVTYVGGICGYLGRDANTHDGWNFRMENCGNFGNITATGSGTMYVGGVSAYGWGGNVGSNGLANGLLNCFNAGNIKVDNSGDDSVKAYVSGVIGYFNTSVYTLENCFNAGTITTNKTTYATLIGWNNRGEGAEGVTADYCKNNYSVASGDIPAFYNGPVSETVGCTVATADQFASGEVAYLINEAAGATVYYQAIGTDKAPTLIAAEDGSNVVEKKADGTYGNPVKEPETTEPEETKPAEPVPTGDSALIFAVVALISVLGIAIVAKRREN